MRSARFALQAQRLYSSFAAGGQGPSLQAPWSLPALALTASPVPFSCSFHGSSNEDGNDDGMAKLREMLRGSSRQPPAPEQIKERDAQRMMDDPLSLLMASRGMPLGLTLKLKSGKGEEKPSISRELLERAEQRVASQLSDLARSAGSGGQAEEELQQLMRASDNDSWGTTRQSAAEIARHIADSNAGAGSGDEGDGEGEGDDEELQAALEAQQQASLEAYGRDMKEMDEIFEIIAKVPWLKEDDVDDLQLRGVVTMGLIGTLEEVGWDIRAGIHRVWQGERQAEAVVEGKEGKDQAALVSILYHTQLLEKEFGPPPSRPSAQEAAAVGGGS